MEIATELKQREYIDIYDGMIGISMPVLRIIRVINDCSNFESCYPVWRFGMMPGNITDKPIVFTSRAGVVFDAICEN